MKSYSVSATSVSHTFGNVTAFVTEYVKSWFPINYFRTVNISSTIAYRYFNIFDNSNKEFIKKNKPMLIIRPRVDLMNDDVFLRGSLLTTRITDNFLDRDFGNLQPFIEDAETGIEVRYLMNRIKMFFDISIIVESQIEQLNQASFIKNRVRQDLPFVIQTALESNIPRPIMEGISKVKGIDIDDTKEFLEYINGVSYYPVTYKMKNASGNDEFFRYYPAHIDAIITGLQIDEGSRKGFIDDVFTINFTIETEFTTSGLYYIFTRDPKALEIIGVGITDFNIQDGEDSAKLIPSFTIEKLFDQPIPPGWNIYVSTFYKVEASKIPDVMSFEPLINRSLKAAINYHLEKGISFVKMIKFFIFKDNTLLSEKNKDFEINYETLEITTNVTNIISTYRLLIVVNTLYINELVGEMISIDEHK